jgi:hypothetical protein
MRPEAAAVDYRRVAPVRLAGSARPPTERDFLLRPTVQSHPMTIKLFALALLCASGVGCAPDALGPRSSPAALRWGFAGANHSVRMEYDGATMVAEGSVVRVWIRMINLRDVTPAKPNPDPFLLIQDAFDCVRGERRSLVMVPRGEDGRTREPIPQVPSEWKQSVHDPKDPLNVWGQNLVYVCRAAGMPYAGKVVIPDEPAG